MDPSQWNLSTQRASHNPEGIPVQADGPAQSLRPASSFSDDLYDQHGFRSNKDTVAGVKVTVKVKTPKGGYGAWPMELSLNHTVREVKDRIALFVSHKLWGGAYRVS